MNRNHKEIDDDIFNKVSGSINIKEKRSKQFFKTFIKGVAFFTIAAVSGGISGAFVTGKKNATILYQGLSNPTNQENLQQSDSSTVYKNDIARVVDKISPALVGVKFKGTNAGGESGVEREGNGIVFKPEGYIITSYKVVNGLGSIKVFLANLDSPMEGKLIGYDVASDIAVIKIETKNLVFVKFGDTTKINIGDPVVALGNSFTKEKIFSNATTGIICATNKSIEIKDSLGKSSSMFSIFLTDAVMNQFNVNGPLCNISGEMIGINTLQLGSYSGSIGGLGFALSINNVSKIVDSIINIGITNKPQLGVRAITAVLNDKNIKGAYIQEVVPTTGADTAGIKPTDIIIAIDGQKITKIENITAILKNHKVNDKVSVKILRNNKTIDVDVILSEQRNNNL